MDALIEMLQAVGVFVAGLAMRIGFLLAVVAVLVAPVALLVGAARGFRSVRRRLLGFSRAGDLLFRPGLRYAPGHTWLEPRGKALRVGLDDLAQRILPWALGVELPRPGTRVRAGDPVATISCGGRDARITAPVDGLVVAVNPAVLSDPSLVKREPQGAGWLFSMEPADDGWRSLPTGEPARTWLASESARLVRFTEQQLGLAAADGGEWIAPPPSLLTPEQWEAMLSQFLAPPR